MSRLIRIPIFNLVVQIPYKSLFFNLIAHLSNGDCRWMRDKEPYSCFHYFPLNDSILEARCFLHLKQSRGKHAEGYHQQEERSNDLILSFLLGMNSIIISSGTTGGERRAEIRKAARAKATEITRIIMPTPM